MVKKGKATKKGCKYYYDTYVDGVRYRSKKFKTRKEAEIAEEELFVPKGITFNIAIDDYVTIKSRRWKLSSYRSIDKKLDNLRYFLGEVEITKLTVTQFQNFLQYLEDKDYSPKYINMVLMYTKSICKYADLYLDAKTKVPFLFDNYQLQKKKVRVLTEEEFEQFIKYVPEKYQNIFIFLFYSGCRVGEAMALTEEDVDRNKKTVTINKTFSKVENKPTTPKTQSSCRTIPLTQKAFDALSPGAPYIFGGEKPIAHTTLRRIRDIACQNSGIPKFRIHDLRHSFVSLLVSNGADVATVAHYIGHSSPNETLRTYSHLFENKLNEVIKKI